MRSARLGSVWQLRQVCWMRGRESVRRDRRARDPRAGKNIASEKVREGRRLARRVQPRRRCAPEPWRDSAPVRDRRTSAPARREIYLGASVHSLAINIAFAEYRPAVLVRLNKVRLN